jgi:hypothetical protein
MQFQQLDFFITAINENHYVVYCYSLLNEPPREKYRRALFTLLS